MKHFLLLFLIQALILNHLNAAEFESDELLVETESENNRPSTSLLEKLVQEYENSESSDGGSNNVKRAAAIATAFRPKLIKIDDANQQQELEQSEVTVNLKKSLERFISRQNERQNIGYNKRMGRVFDTDLCKNVICTNVPSNGQIAKTWKLVQQATCCYRKPLRFYTN